MRKFRLVSEMRKGQRSWGRVVAPNSRNKANMGRNFAPIKALATIKAVSMTAVKWDAYDVVNTAGNAGRCHPDRQNSS